MNHFNLYFDDDPASALSFAMTPDSGQQDFEFAARNAKKVTLEFLTHHGGHSNGDRDILTIDRIAIRRQLPKENNVIELSHPAGLMKYPRGKGGILLNQLDYTEKEQGPKFKNTKLNIEKKRNLYSNLLRNMGATFKSTGDLEKQVETK